MNTLLPMSKRLLIALAFAVFIPLIAFAAPTEEIPTTSPDQIGVYWSEDLNDAMTRYLERHAGFTSRGGKTFWAFEILDQVPADFEGPTGETEQATRFDLWVVFEEYVMHAAETPPQLEQGSGMSGPLSITVRDEDGRFAAIDHWQPRDGASFDDDIRAHMTPKAADAALGGEFDVHNNRVIRLREAILEQVHAYFELDESSSAASSAPAQPASPDQPEAQKGFFQNFWEWIRSFFS